MLGLEILQIWQKRLYSNLFYLEKTLNFYSKLMKKIKKWDPVIVIAGKHKWKVSVVEKVLENSLFIKWVNEVKKAVKWQWFVKKILPLPISNVMYYYEKEKKPSRIGIQIDEKWKKKRILRKFNVVID